MSVERIHASVREESAKICLEHSLVTAQKASLLTRNPEYAKVILCWHKYPAPLASQGGIGTEVG